MARPPAMAIGVVSRPERRTVLQAAEVWVDEAAALLEDELLEELDEADNEVVAAAN